MDFKQSGKLKKKKKKVQFKFFFSFYFSTRDFKQTEIQTKKVKEARFDSKKKGISFQNNFLSTPRKRKAATPQKKVSNIFLLLNFICQISIVKRKFYNI